MISRLYTKTLQKSQETALIDNKKLVLLSEQFYEWLKVKGYREQTVSSYKKRLKKFLDYVQNETKITGISQVGRKEIHAFQTYLYYINVSVKRANESRSNAGSNTACNTSYSSGTQLSILSALKQFFRFLYKTDRVTYDPTANLKMPKRPKRLPFVPSLEEVSLLLKQPDCSTNLGFRDRTIMEVLYSTGIRAGELCALNLYDVDLDQSQLYIREGKGGKERVVPIGSIAANYLHEYLVKTHTQLKKNASNEALFLSCFGRRLLSTDMSQMIRKYKDKAAIDKPLTPHSLRHACASHLLKAGCDIRYIQQLLGHESLSTTQVYTKVEITDLKTMHRSCHPREKKLKEFD